MRVERNRRIRLYVVCLSVCVGAFICGGCDDGGVADGCVDGAATDTGKHGEIRRGPGVV